MEKSYASQTQENLCGPLSQIFGHPSTYTSISAGGRTIVKRYTGYDEYLDTQNRQHVTLAEVESNPCLYSGPALITQDELERELWSGFDTWNEPYWIGQNSEAYSRAVGYGLAA